ncbi:C-X-C chemokine receptor type 3-like isoform X2 [Sinocyclocheilus anshuiensis]|uniref:C-X-C chemokine receptor type 3-like isoform X2 n=1 Tax=Sinocyclocheilus anshuiensis TaxID=1608454 RepID=UPI0007BA148A|nr:PREDICTED: C-X-C chemokine receptor type 3-like isoform X2 [Sinocyclocheilus anshuiensis]
MSRNMATHVDLHGLFEDNNTFDYEDYEYKEICPSSTVSGALAVFMPLLYSVGFLCGLLGNGLVLAILWLKTLNLSVMDMFVLLLSVTDSMLLLTLPLWAVDAVKGWIMGTELCKLSGVLFEINFYCGIFTLACLSVDNYLSIVRGVQLFSRIKPVVVYCCCLIICVLCMLLSIPDLIFLSAITDQGKQECIHHYPPDSWRLASRLPHLFVLLVLVLLFCFSIILLKLRHSSKCQQKKKGQSTAIIAALVLVFFICWTPYSITFIVNTFQSMDSISSAVEEDCEGRQWTASKITAVFGLLHCVVNPVVYFCLSKEFRSRVLTVIKFSACKMESNDVSLWDSSGVNGNASVQEEQGSLQPMNDIKQKIKTQDYDI